VFSWVCSLNENIGFRYGIVAFIYLQTADNARNILIRFFSWVQECDPKRFIAVFYFVSQD